MAFETPVSILDRMKHFGTREVGLTHPDLFSYIRLADNGDIHIMVEEGVGIIISQAQRSVILVGDQVKILSRQNEGLKWNDLAFNSKATKFSEPAFLHIKQSRSLYEGVEEYVDIYEENTGA
jgi:hypothetical protein